MKKLILFSLLCFAINSFSQSITRGPEIGEIYFLGPTYTTDGLYYSIDFGETAICVDSVKDIASIAADPSSGGIYCFTYPTSLYYSNNYGNLNSWEFKYAGIDLSSKINSGTELGHIFSGCNMHSEDYGSNYYYHALNGYFGYQNRFTIDNTNENTGYVINYKLTVGDTLYLFRTYDKFENVELIHKFNYLWYEAIDLSGGYNQGEVFMFNLTRNQLWVSFDFFDNLQYVDNFNISSYSGVGIEGGNTEGELYILYKFINLMWQNAHTYIFHSLDYGKTFEVFHPFAKGIEPVLANFSTDTTEGEMPFTVDFCNFSIGDIQQYQWDFENDGIVDSYEQSPSYTYVDTGFYSVRLTITGLDSSNTFLKENYIHVVKTTGIKDLPQPVIKSYPNPFSNYVTFEINNNEKERKLLIYDNCGKKIKTLIVPERADKITWDGKNSTGVKCKPGIYYVKLSDNTLSRKILLAY